MPPPLPPPSSLSIQSLPIDTVHLIAAGEVIDSLAAVVRELAENAIDAGATRLSIWVEPERWWVRVTDNGWGMDEENLQRAALAHSTSKIRASQDLTQITSLGFRGEALHSLAQLAHLDICSRPKDAAEGWRMHYNSQGMVTEAETVAIAPGTVVTVNHLFETWPARRLALPSLPQQLRAIQLEIQHLALCHPALTWQVRRGDRDWFAIYPGQSARTIIPQLLREVQPDDLREQTRLLESPPDSQESTASESELSPDATQDSSQAASLYTLIGLPDRCHRRRSDWVKVAINGRVVRSPDLEQTILGAFRRTLPRDRQPLCFIHLRVSPESVDWNRHPAKSEMYLGQMDQWREAVREAIAQTLSLTPQSLSEGFYADRVSRLLKTAESNGTYRAVSSSNPQSTPSSKPPLPLRAIAQVHRTYILAEHPSGLCLIEQHIAHERVLYERLCDQWELVSLDAPLILSRLSEAQVETLERLDLDIDAFGEGLWAVRTVPAPLSQRQDCADALVELSLGGDLDTARVAIACRTAIRNGTTLSLPDMQTLLNDWQQTQHPHTCPHGRPICLTLEESRLSRFFRRHWVIGKSHGI